MVNPIPRWAAVEDIAVRVSPIPDTKPPIMTSLRCENNPSNAVATGPTKKVECQRYPVRVDSVLFVNILSSHCFANVIFSSSLNDSKIS